MLLRLVYLAIFGLFIAVMIVVAAVVVDHFYPFLAANASEREHPDGDDHEHEHDGHDGHDGGGDGHDNEGGDGDDHGEDPGDGDGSDCPDEGDGDGDHGGPDPRPTPSVRDSQHERPECPQGMIVKNFFSKECKPLRPEPRPTN